MVFIALKATSSEIVSFFYGSATNRLTYTKKTCHPIAAVSALKGPVLVSVPLLWHVCAVKIEEL